MADADALLIRKLIVAALEGGDAHTDLGKAFGMLLTLAVEIIPTI
jgi:hypothetical protein